MQNDIIYYDCNHKCLSLEGIINERIMDQIKYLDKPVALIIAADDVRMEVSLVASIVDLAITDALMEWQKQLTTGKKDGIIRE